MKRLVIYNEQMLETAVQSLEEELATCGRLNLSYEKASKEKTLKQMGFIFAALIGQITNYFRECGFVLDEEDVRYKLYDDVSKIVPEMVVDRQIFGGRPRVKHLGEMDRELCSKFISGIFTILDTEPIYAGIQLTPDTYYNYVFHLDPEEIKSVKNTELPERDENYLAYVHDQPCIVCGLQHRSHAHHAKIPRYVSNSKKTPDWTAIPLCYLHHLQGAHQQGHNWLEERLKWLPIDLETFCRLNYLRWKNKKNR